MTYFFMINSTGSLTTGILLHKRWAVKTKGLMVLILAQEWRACVQKVQLRRAPSHWKLLNSHTCAGLCPFTVDCHAKRIESLRNQDHSPSANQKHTWETIHRHVKDPVWQNTFWHGILAFQAERFVVVCNLSAETVWQHLIFSRQCISSTTSKVKVWTHPHYCFCLSAWGGCNFPHSWLHNIPLKAWVMFREINYSAGDFTEVSSNSSRKTWQFHVCVCICARTISPQWTK